MTHDSIIFDLDGTLWDTCTACAVAWNNVLRRANIPFRTIVAEDVRVVTGNPHDECIRITFKELPEVQIRMIVEQTMDEDNRMIEELGGELFPDVADGLRTLSEHFRLFIVSNCQSGYIETFLRQSGLGDVFEDIECWGNTGESKSENLRRVIERNGLLSPLMVGDAEGDEVAARACKVPFAFVEYGFRGCVAPDHRFATFGALVKHLLGT